MGSVMAYFFGLYISSEAFTTPPAPTPRGVIYLAAKTLPFNNPGREFEGASIYLFITPWAKSAVVMEMGTQVLQWFFNSDAIKEHGKGNICSPPNIDGYLIPTATLL